ncbi:MAG: hypothetical protein [brine shrimp arlivirus 8]|nr:MAG: hypothetical protein [brine shrimp arlivirus 8]UNI74125.1 MAG: hypothetical protein [brine shrimp arlivirus 8]UNI74130.1 MAG: hypothetical protein [brine shrimp arlivirus 8]UNI74135.1 MAG: hypothetical protein [brine shrimp arlivirus 8]
MSSQQPNKGAMLPMTSKLAEMSARYSSSVGNKIASSQGIKNLPALTVTRQWHLVNFGTIPGKGEMNAAYLFGVLNTENCRPEILWSSLAYILNIDRGNFIRALSSEGYVLFEPTFEEVDPAPDKEWVRNTFFSDPALINDIGIVVTILGSLLCIMLGKVLNDNNMTYLGTRTKKLAEMAQVRWDNFDWFRGTPVMDNIIKMSAVMSQTPYVRAIFFNRLLMAVSTPNIPLVKLWEYAVQMLDGAFMTPQISILSEIATRSQVIVVFPEIREEMTRFLAWYDKLSKQEKDYIGYLRMLSGKDKTAPVSINRLPLCTAVAIKLYRCKSSTMANYQAPERLDERLQRMADGIVHWVLEHEARTPDVKAHMLALDLTEQDILDVYKQLSAAKTPDNASDLTSF